MVWPITIALLAVFLTGAFALSVMLGRQQQKRERYRSVISRQRGDDGRGGDADSKALARQRADIAKKLKQASDEHQEKKKDRTTVRELMLQAGIEAPLSRYWIGSALTALFVWVLLLLTSWPGIAKMFTIVFAFFGLPKIFLKKKAARRQKKFLKEFADALEAMGRLLQAGMPMSEAIAMASREFTGPLKEEMLRIYENQKVGVPIGEAARMTAQRVPLPEAHMFATALQIQSETGSSLSEVLYNLAGVIRARFRLKRKVQALSSEAKASAMIIGCLPLVVIFGMWLARPQYIGILFTTGSGKFILGCCVGWMLLGVLMMRQMINFRI